MSLIHRNPQNKDNKERTFGLSNAESAFRFSFVNSRHRDTLRTRRLFERPQALAEMPMGAARDSLALRYGRDVPKRALEALLQGQSFNTWLAGLSPEIWDHLRCGDQAQKLLSAVQALVDDSDQLLRR